MTEPIDTSPARLMELAEALSGIRSPYVSSACMMLCAVAAEKEAQAKQEPFGFVEPHAVENFREARIEYSPVYRRQAQYDGDATIPLYLASATLEETKEKRTSDLRDHREPLINARSMINFDPRDAFPEDHNRMRAWCINAQAKLGQQAERIKALEATLESERREHRRVRMIAMIAGRAADPGW